MNVDRKYVAFCDIMGFSSAVSANFDDTVSVYKEFKSAISKSRFPKKASVSVYSDSIFIVSDQLKDSLLAVNLLYAVCLRRGWLIRGGIAYGKHWKDSDKNNLFVVSEALVEAVLIEKNVKWPVIAISEKIDLGIEYWVPRFLHDVFTVPVLHYEGLNFVNPFNRYWFNSAAIHIQNLTGKLPSGKEKYEWFSRLIDAVRRDDILVPGPVMAQLIELNLIAKIEI